MRNTFERFRAGFLLALGALWFASSTALACPEGYRRECRTDPCAERRERQVCVRWEDGRCIDYRTETVCVPRTDCTCERS